MGKLLEVIAGVGADGKSWSSFIIVVNLRGIIGTSSVFDSGSVNLLHSGC